MKTNEATFRSFDPFKASLALSIERRREQNHDVASKQLYDMPAMRSQRTPRGTRRDYKESAPSVGRGVSENPPMPTPIRPPTALPTIEDFGAPRRRPPRYLSPLPPDGGPYSRRSSPGDLHGRGESDPIPEPDSWYRPLPPPHELHASTLPPESSPHVSESAHSGSPTRRRSLSSSELDANAALSRLVFDPEARGHSPTPPTLANPGRNSPSIRSRSPSPIPPIHNMKPWSSQISIHPNNSAGNVEGSRQMPFIRNTSMKSLEKMSIPRSREQGGWEWGKETPEMQKKSDHLPPSHSSSHYSAGLVVPPPDEPSQDDSLRLRKGPSLRAASFRSVSKRSSRRGIPAPEPSVGEVEKEFPPDVEALQRTDILIDFATYLTVFTLDTLPRQIYLHWHLRLPYMYFSRINRVFRTAGLSVEDMKECMLDAALHQQEDLDHSGPRARDVLDENTAYDRLQKTWNLLIDSLMYEWTNLNIISALLLAAILTLLQIDTASSDPLPRYTGFSSMICALMSLLCGYMYIIRFEDMRSSYKIVEWANEVQSSKTGTWWNIWIFLALPATWLVWSIILFVTCAMSLIWRSGTAADSNRSPMTPHQALAGRIVLTVLLAIGIVYLFLVILTLRHFGDKMDEVWHQRLGGWVDNALRDMDVINFHDDVRTRRLATGLYGARESPEYVVDIDRGRFYSRPPPRSPSSPVHLIQISG